MGNRILKESVCLNRKIDQLTDFQENMFYRLIVKVDDYGIFFADPAILASVLYPRKRNLGLKAISEALRRMKEVGLIRLYTAGGEEYLKIRSWEQHQRLRNSTHRYPTPEDAGCENASVGSSAPDEAPRPEDPEDPGDCSSGTDGAEVRELPVVELPLNDGSTYGVTRSEIIVYSGLYPAVNVEQELRNMVGWCMANPLRKKTRNGIRRFVAGWLARVQDKGGNMAQQLPQENPFIRMAAGETARGGPQPNPFDGSGAEGGRAG